MDIVVYFFMPLRISNRRREPPRASQSFPPGLPKASHNLPNLSGAPQTSPDHTRASQSSQELPRIPTFFQGLRRPPKPPRVQQNLVFTSFSLLFMYFSLKKLVFTSFSSFFNDFDKKKLVFTSFASFLIGFLNLWKMTDAKNIDL